MRNGNDAINCLIFMDCFIFKFVDTKEIILLLSLKKILDKEKNINGLMIEDL